MIRPFVSKLIFVLFFVALLHFAFSAQLKAESVLNLKENKVSIKINHPTESPSEMLTISIEAPDLSEPVVEKIENPARIVLDLPNLRLRKNHNLAIQDQKLLKGLRTGNHSDKLRIVLDLSTVDTPEHSWSFNDHRLILMLKQAGVIEGEPSFAKEPKDSALEEEPSPAPTVDESASAEDDLHQDVIVPSVEEASLEAKPDLQLNKEEMQPLPPEPALSTASEISSTPVSTVKPSPTASPNPTQSLPPGTKTLLQQILYDYRGEERKPVLKIALSQKTGFTLTKKSGSLYELKIPGCRLEYDYLTLPHYPPFDFEGFTLVKAKNIETGLAVMVGVDQGTRIKALSVDKEIQITTTK